MAAVLKRQQEVMKKEGYDFIRTNLIDGVLYGGYTNPNLPDKHKLKHIAAEVKEASASGPRNIEANERRTNNVRRTAGSTSQNARDNGKLAKKPAAKPSTVGMPSSLLFAGPSRPT